MKNRILLVDDEPAVIEGLKLALRKEPYEVVAVGSASEAVEALASHRIDVVVSDERMPGMKGSQFLSLVRREYPGIVRILLTGQASVEAAVRAINEGEVFRMLLKPQRADALAATIREALAVAEARRRGSPDDNHDAGVEDRGNLAVGMDPDLLHVRRARDGTIHLDEGDVDLSALAAELEGG